MDSKRYENQAGSLRYHNPYNRICSSYTLCVGLRVTIPDYYWNLIYS